MQKFFIDGYWKNDKSEFQDYIVASYDDAGEDDDVFYYGINEDDIIDAIQSGENTDLEFVITSYRLDGQSESTYFLFGSKAVAHYFEHSIDGLPDEFETFEFIQGKTHPADLLDASFGWEDYATISRLEFTILNRIKK